MRAQKRKIHIEMSRDAPLFTLHESSVAITSAILPHCMSANHDVKDPLLFPARHRYDTAASRRSFWTSRPKRRGAHYNIKRDILHLTLCQCLCFCWMSGAHVIRFHSSRFDSPVAAKLHMWSPEIHTEDTFAKIPKNSTSEKLFLKMENLFASQTHKLANVKMMVKSVRPTTGEAFWLQVEQGLHHHNLTTSAMGGCQGRNLGSG